MNDEIEIIVTRRSELEKIISESMRKVLNERDRPIVKDEDQIFNVKQAAQFLNLAPQTIYGLTSKRLIPFFKRRKNLYFKKSELQQWIYSGRKKTIAEMTEKL